MSAIGKVQIQSNRRKYTDLRIIKYSEVQEFYKLNTLYVLIASEFVTFFFLENLLLRKCCTFPETVRSPAITFIPLHTPHFTFNSSMALLPASLFNSAKKEHKQTQVKQILSKKKKKKTEKIRKGESYLYQRLPALSSDVHFEKLFLLCGFSL